MKSGVPTINFFPEEYTSVWKHHRFVQFRVDNDPYLRLGLDMGHVDIVMRFCEELEIGHREEKGPYGNRVIHPNDPKVKIAGMGFIYLTEGTCYYSGKSPSYELGPDAKHMSEIAERFSDKKFIFE